jgi:sphingosine kinase
VIDVLTTTHHNHAAEHMETLDADTLKSYYAVICFSGDGVYHELLNGFYKRPDHATLSLRLAGALGGGACGMALSALKEWNLTKTL